MAGKREQDRQIDGVRESASNRQTDKLTERNEISKHTDTLAKEKKYTQPLLYLRLS